MVLALYFGHDDGPAGHVSPTTSLASSSPGVWLHRYDPITGVTNVLLVAAASRVHITVATAVASLVASEAYMVWTTGGQHGNLISDLSTAVQLAIVCVLIALRERHLRRQFLRHREAAAAMEATMSARDDFERRLSALLPLPTLTSLAEGTFEDEVVECSILWIELPSTNVHAAGSMEEVERNHVAIVRVRAEVDAIAAANGGLLCRVSEEPSTFVVVFGVAPGPKLFHENRACLSAAAVALWGQEHGADLRCGVHTGTVFWTVLVEQALAFNALGNAIAIAEALAAAACRLSEGRVLISAHTNRRLIEVNAEISYTSDIDTHPYTASHNRETVVVVHGMAPAQRLDVLPGRGQHGVELHHADLPELGADSSPQCAVRRRRQQLLLSTMLGGQHPKIRVASRTTFAPHPAEMDGALQFAALPPC